MREAGCESTSTPTRIGVIVPRNLGGGRRVTVGPVHIVLDHAEKLARFKSVAGELIWDGCSPASVRAVLWMSFK